MINRSVKHSCEDLLIIVTFLPSFMYINDDYWVWTVALSTPFSLKSLLELWQTYTYINSFHWKLAPCDVSELFITNTGGDKYTCLMVKMISLHQNVQNVSKPTTPEPSCRKRCWKKLHSKVEVFKFLSGLKINTFCLKLLSGSTSTLCGSWMALLCEYVHGVNIDVLYCTDLRTNTPKGDLHCRFLACAAVCLVG